MKQKHFIDLHKGVTGLGVLALMAAFDQWSNATAWVYLALHGSYGILWVLKSRLFPDKQWDQPTGWGYGLVILGGLTLYWAAPFLLVWRGVQAPLWLIGLAIFLYTVGVFCHFTADMQKHITLALRPGELVTDGLWGGVRNPNYLGELMIYLSFALLSLHWLPILILALFLGIVWIPNMRRKDLSLSRFPEYAAYRARTKWLIPRVL